MRNAKGSVVMVAVLGLALLVGGQPVGVASGGETPSAIQQRAAESSSLTFGALIAQVAVEDLDLEATRQKQINLVDQTCDAAADLAALSVARAEAAGRPQELSQALAVEEEQRSQCDIAKDAVQNSTVEEIRALGVKRKAETTLLVEYTGEDRSVPPDPLVDPPSWVPGDPTLENEEYLGSGYKPDGDADGVCNLKKTTVASDSDPFVSAAKSDHGRALKGYDEWCAEVIGDGIGDDDGFCEMQDPKGPEKAFKEACVTMTRTLDDIEQDDDNIDVDTLRDYDDVLDVSLASATTARFYAAEMRGAFEADARTASLTTSLGYCGYEVQETIPVWALITYWALADVGQGVSDTSDFIGDQTAFGFNSSAGFSWAPIINSVTQALVNSQEVLADGEVAANVANAFRCIDELGRQLQDNGEILEGVGDDVDALKHISLDVIALKDKELYLVTATVAGHPVSGATFSSVKVSDVSPVGFVGLVAGEQWNVSEVPGAPGTYQVTFALPPSLRSVRLFTIDVEHDGAFGHVIFDRSSFD